MNATTNGGAESCPAFPPSLSPFTPEVDAHLRDILKRCPAPTYQAARGFRQTGEPRYLTTIVFGVIERFVEPDLRPRLKNPTDSLCLIEDLGIDSLTMMEIVILIEDVLAITITNDELRPLRTLGDVRQFIATKLYGRPGREAQVFSKTG